MSEYHIGNTPMHIIQLENGNRIFIKMEKYNFLHSIKARTAYYIVKNLYLGNRRGVVESTSGNLGLALDYFLKELNIEFLCLIDESISKEKLEKLKEHHINYYIVEKESNMDLRSSRINLAKRLHDSGEYYWCNQYENVNCMEAHYYTTAPEIWQQCEGKINACICPVGTGGMISGVAKYMKERNPNICMIGVEPLGSTIFGGTDGNYINAGTGLRGPSGLIREHISYIDGYYQIPDIDSVYYCKQLKKQYSLELGISSAMTYVAALQYSMKVYDQNFVIIAPDGMDSYLSVLNSEEYERKDNIEYDQPIFKMLRHEKQTGPNCVLG